MRTDRQLVERLRKIPLFAACSKDELQQIAAAASTLTFPAGTVLAREGDVGREFMVIDDGTADVVIGGAVVNQLGPDDSFGEVALLDGGVRTATVVASTDVVAYVIEQREFVRARLRLPVPGPQAAHRSRQAASLGRAAARTSRSARPR